MNATSANAGINSVEPVEDEPSDKNPRIPDIAQEARESRLSWKAILAVALMLLSLIAATTFAVTRALSSGKKDAEAEARRLTDRPSAAAAEPRKLDMTTPAKVQPNAPASASSDRMIPAIIASADDESPEPIGVRRTGEPTSSGPQRISPQDAPVTLVSSRPSGGTAATAASRPSAIDNPDDPLAGTKRNLEGYQRQLQGLLDTLTKSSESALGAQDSPSPPNHPGQTVQGHTSSTPNTGLFGGQLQASATPRVAAAMLASTPNQRSLTLPKGTAFTCALKTRIISAASGLVSCQVQRNVYGDDGRVLLIERGSHMDGEYRIAAVRPGMVRIPVLWTRVRTPLGVTVDIESPATGPLGESGIDGFVDNRWGERLGAAMLLSLIDDSVKLVMQNHSNNNQADTILLPATTANTSKLAEKVLDSTINIPPLIYQHQGAIVAIYVARDVDFSSVYALTEVSK
ncbi:type IV secretion system protein VirB10 [Paucibacter sp. B2R-40]|uniref:type IV secretion system protein VirB10 n=1 Tax=Paucibacter sp. B2R-40 TaxID=2893554 RepID=UPI0021E48526|nr:type IV secretion system protein VirB10 [Paucibacter sp. B2R-40]MCV2354021.1 type IV secretion system protein VirB10 [Paucibacter sp. B2R-40]